MFLFTNLYLNVWSHEAFQTGSNFYQIYIELVKIAVENLTSIIVAAVYSAVYFDLIAPQVL